MLHRRLVWGALSALGLAALAGGCLDDPLPQGPAQPGVGTLGSDGSDSTSETVLTVRVATWNLETVGDLGTAEYDAALAVLARVGADVVAINEVGSAADVANVTQLAADAGYPYLEVGTVSFGGMRNAMLSRWPMTSWVHTSASLSGDPAANDLTRDIVEALVDVPDNDRDLTVVVQHWKSGTDNTDEFRRGVESLRVAQTVDDLLTTDDAYVFVGDVNDEIDSVPHSPNPFTEEPTGLPSSFDLGTDLEAELAGPGIQNNPFFYLERDTGPDAVALDAFQLDGSVATRPSTGRRIDYALTSKLVLDFGPASQVYDSADEGLSGSLPLYGSAPSAGTSLTASDHLLVFADVTVPPPSCVGDADCDDGRFCNGVESCVASACAAGTDPCGGAACDEVADSCDGPPVCNYNGVCDPGEDCEGCPDDCCAVCNEDGVCDVVDGEDCDGCAVDCVTGAACGNGVCEAGDGEDCLSCPADCNGKQGGKPSKRFCCGDGDGENPVDCSDGRCSEGGLSCSDAPAPATCCGDLVCEGAEDGYQCAFDCGAPPECGDLNCDPDEDSCSCPADCGAPPPSETSCTEGEDEDCDGAADCDDSDCSEDPACSCLPPGAACTEGAECCSESCKGKPGSKTCK